MRWKILFLIGAIMKLLFFLVLLVGGGTSLQRTFRLKMLSKDIEEEAFQKWMTEHEKYYRSDEEYRRRKETFRENVQKIQRLNGGYKTASDVQFSVNKFADLTEEEFQEKILMPKRNPVTFSRSKYLGVENHDTLPDQFDWNKKGIIGPVRDQGDAGTCWAFSTVETLEGKWVLKTGNMVELSVEQVVDCDDMQSSKQADCGVFGGWPYLAYDYIKQAGGIEKEGDYSYCSGLGGDKGTCYVCPAKDYNKTLCGPPAEFCKKSDSCTAKLNSSLFVPGLRVKDWSYISENETEMAMALISEGPLSVLINSGTLQFYKSGVWDPILCDPKSLDHAVLLTGYGSSQTVFGQKDYWKIKNSWGKKWGEDGYFRIARNKGKCGINTQVTTVHLED